jgi:4-amino-4-deoxy-L-arabinose transferase-like glycosyltransferase
VVEVVGFFYFANLLTKKWANYSPKRFNKQLFLTAFLLRLAWVLVAWVFYSAMNGEPFEFEVADAKMYHETGIWIHYLLTSHQGFKPFIDTLKAGYSDAGYSIYLGCLYYLTGDSILIERILKAIFGAFMCVLIYKLSFRNFGEEVARMAAIFCMLMPNLIYYSGLHLKEVEMVLLTVWYMERADLMLRNKNFNFVEIAPPLLLAISLFFLRTVLGAAALFALFTALMFSSTKVVGWGKRIVLIVWILGAVSYFVGGQISNEVEEVWQARKENQKQSLAFRSIQVGGNKFAKYASSAIFAPIIFIMPFPTMVNTQGQQNSQLIHGANYVKNILGFFVFFAIFWVIKNQKWREYILLESFTVGYLIVIAFSSFAQAERFHQPALPFLLIFAAFGVSKVTNKTKKYFSWYMAIIFVAIVVWSWFKLAGRGMV